MKERVAEPLGALAGLLVCLHRVRPAVAAQEDPSLGSAVGVEKKARNQCEKYLHSTNCCHLWYSGHGHDLHRLERRGAQRHG